MGVSVVMVFRQSERAADETIIQDTPAIPWISSKAWGLRSLDRSPWSKPDQHALAFLPLVKQTADVEASWKRAWMLVSSWNGARSRQADESTPHRYGKAIGALRKCASRPSTGY